MRENKITFDLSMKVLVSQKLTLRWYYHWLHAQGARAPACTMYPSLCWIWQNAKYPIWRWSCYYKSADTYGSQNIAANLQICAASVPLRLIKPTVSRHVTWVSTLKKLALAGSGESIFTHSQTTGPDGPHTLEAWMGLVVKGAYWRIEQVWVYG